MQLISINIGRTQAIQGAKVSRTTGIYKQPVGTAQITATVAPNGRSSTSAHSPPTSTTARSR